VIRERTTLTSVVSTTHQPDEPAKTPAVRRAAPGMSSPRIPRPTNNAAKDRIVIGFVSVNASVVR